MDFEFTEEHRLLEQSVREWAGREVAPRIRELDRAHRFDRGLLPQMASLGLLGISVPVEQGGAGMDYLALGLACEERPALAERDSSMPFVDSGHVAFIAAARLHLQRPAEGVEWKCPGVHWLQGAQGAL
jgi:glutaryl-CoA dehydrogenase (non-decarboxylating)